jgi:hypothetical protein
MNALVILACIVQSIEHGPTTDPRCDTPYVREVHASITHWATEYGVPAHIEAAKIYHESRFDKHARGARGEVGVSQLLRRGAIQGADLKLTRAQLEDVDTNIRIGTKYLAQFVIRCKHPSGWLTKYNRPARGCRPSRYSRGVLADLRAARRFRLENRPVEALGSGPATENSNWALNWTPDHTSRKQADSRTATTRGTRGSLHSGTDPTPRSPDQVLESISAPFAEP